LLARTQLTSVELKGLGAIPVVPREPSLHGEQLNITSERAVFGLFQYLALVEHALPPLKKILDVLVELLQFFLQYQEKEAKKRAIKREIVQTY
jgi:hypothetical protein